jgi:hypothetical protein
MDGSLDMSFGTGGKVTTNFGGTSLARAVALQTDGKIVAAGNTFVSGSFNFALARYEAVTPATICKEAILSPVVSGPAGGKAEILFVQSDTEIHQQFSVTIKRALANNSYRVLVEISSGEPVDLGQQLDFGFVETDRNGNANVTWSSSPKNGERDIRPLLPPGIDVRNFAGVIVAHGGGTIIFLSGKFSLCRDFSPVESSSRPADSQARVLPPCNVATPQ